jgi:hypothetical protein
MKNAVVLFILVTMLACRQKTYHVVEIENPEYRKNVAFVSSEDLSDPRFNSLRTKYQLDTIFHGEQDEFKRILLLRDWIKHTISINDYGDPYPGNGSAEGILDAALSGQGFHCGHFMTVQNAIMNSYGYVTRCLGSGPGVKGGPDGHHGMNEIWLNSRQKWFLSDAKYNHHFEKNGVPLSALEVRDEYLKNKAADIVMVKGASRTPIDSDGLADARGKIQKKTRADFAQWYTWLEWDRSNSRYTAFPHFNSPLNMYEDEYTRTHTWIWDGKTHWAFNTDYVNFIKSREAIEWTPNTTQVQVTIKEDTAKFVLTSITPNLKEYQVRDLSGDEWKKCDSVLTMSLDKAKYELAFRAVNLADVSGPESKVVIASE